MNVPRFVWGLAGVAVVALVFGARVLIGAPVIPYQESYAHLLASSEVRSAIPMLNGFWGVQPSMIDVLLACFPSVVWLVGFQLLLAFVAGWSAGIVGERVLGRSGWLVGLLAVCSPTFLFLFSTINPWSAVVVVFLFGLVLLPRFPRAGLLLWSSAFLFDMWSGLLLVGLGCMIGSLRAQLPRLFGRRDGNERGLVVFFLVSCVVSFALRLVFVPPSWRAHLLSLKYGAGAFFPFVEFGVQEGVSFILVVLGLIGFVRSWRKSWRWVVLQVGVVVLFGSVVIFEGARIFAWVVLTCYAALALSWMGRRKWELQEVQRVSLFIIGCSLLLVFASALKGFILAKPDKELLEGVSFLSSGWSDGILAHPADAPFVAFSTGKKVFLLHTLPLDDDLQERVRALRAIWLGRDLNTTLSLLNRYDIRFIIVTPEMRDGAVWERDEEGLLFFLEHSERFINVNPDLRVEIWRVIQK
ncbi:hypothetical protein D6783_04895 [Candidatus Woesearchaeota archaeon]|nr:MAG: hypothetical protein D6783_04895 [Candidatus Woesearchaeota archaeon]